ncbi:MAG: hypothetical protein ABEJ40_10805 [Haloarculaceae archaeon]
MSKSFRETFWDVACSSKHRIHVLFIVSSTFLIVGVLSWPFIEPGTPAYVMIVIDFALLGTMFVFSVVVLYRCRQRQTGIVDDF